jgi:hypothetical protein
VTCSPLDPSPPRVLDHLLVAFSSSAVYGIEAHTRPIAPPASDSDVVRLLSAAVHGDASQSMPAFADSLGKCEPGGVSDVAVRADLQCQGIANDVCMCAGGSVRCVTAGVPAEAAAGASVRATDDSRGSALAQQSLVTAPGFVHEGDLAGAAQLPWCSDGDHVAGWLLLKVSVPEACLSYILKREAACSAGVSMQCELAPPLALLIYQ